MTPTPTPATGPSHAGDGQTLPARLLDILVCPVCGGRISQLRLDQIRCDRCTTEYTVRGGVPRMVTSDLPDSVAETAEAFGWQWNVFTDQHREFRGEFLEWMAPIKVDDFRGKRVLDVGCGKGRHVMLAADFGAEYVVGLDISSAVDVAQRLTSDHPNINIVQGNLLTPPLAENAFDLIYSVGVIHHVPEPAQAVQALTKCLHPGGTLHIWVYGYEGNALVRLLVEPLRQWLARGIPRRFVRIATYPPAVVLMALAHVVRRLGPFPFLPYQQYLRELGRFSVAHIWTIIYDQLMAPTTHYVKRQELVTWLRAAGLENIQIRNSRGMSWAGTAQRPQACGMPQSLPNRPE